MFMGYALSAECALAEHLSETVGELDHDSDRCSRCITCGNDIEIDR